MPAEMVREGEGNYGMACERRAFSSDRPEKQTKAALKGQMAGLSGYTTLSAQ